MGKKGDKMTGASTRAAESLQAALSGLGEIQIRKMFGGHGIFEDSAMFALIDSDGKIFFKVDDTNREMYEAAGAPKHGRMPYYAVPDAILEDEQLLTDWASRSIQVSK